MDSATKSTLLKLLSFSTSQNQKLFVVGGTLRDYLLKKPFSDFDLAGENASQIGINFSHTMNFTSILLDKTPGRRTVRVILNGKKHLDFSDFQGITIEKDLSQRDFTINAMAQTLSDFLSNKRVFIDPHKGQEDLIKKKIRILFGTIIQSDPIRMLRAFRFAAILNFEIDTETLINISLHKARLKESAAERIWHELSLFFKTPETLPLLKVMHKCGLLDCILPLSSQSFEQYQIVESLFNYPKKIFPEYMTEFSAMSFLKKHYLVKLSVLLSKQSSISKTNSIRDHGEICNFCLSNAEKNIIIQSMNGAISLTDAYLNTEFNKNYELSQKIHEELLASVVLFVTGSNVINKKGRVFFCKSLLKFYYEKFLPIVSKKPLINGKDIIDKFQLPPSPLFGKILNCVQKEQVLGNITTREDALKLAENIIKFQAKES
jgi:tRNA nucleotidyltransferase/poly(A) polymerase